MTKHKKKLLVLSTPRSGTRFVSMLLRNSGVKVGHEGFKRDGTVGMFFAVEDVWYPGKHWTTDDEHPVEDQSRQRRSDFEFEQVWHCTRDPRKVIPALASRQFTDAIWCWQERHTGISCGIYPKKLRAMKFWLAWNELIEKNEQIDFFFRVEDIDAQWGRICTRLDIPLDTVIPAGLPRDYGTAETGPNRHQPMNWDEMKALDADLADKIRAMAVRYGYDDNEVVPRVPTASDDTISDIAGGEAICA
jgi:hypothetical protein